MEINKEYKCHGGRVTYYSHQSLNTKTAMSFSLSIPKDVQGKIPYIIFLSGLTCSEDNFTTKANAYKKASELGLAILVPDTSPRGKDIPDDESYDLGQGAGFYINAVKSPWSENFQMESYIIDELIPLAEQEFNLDSARKSITGHSMGGHGALTLYLKYRDRFKSCSAFSPIVAPSKVAWGEKAFSNYLGDCKTEWLKHDACELVSTSKDDNNGSVILIDQGLDDDFLTEQLRPELFKSACEKSGQKLELRLQAGYDHSYFFIQSFIDEHLDWHFKYLNK